LLADFELFLLPVRIQFKPGIGKHCIGPVGRWTLLAGTTSALSATRWGLDPNRPTRRAFF